MRNIPLDELANTWPKVLPWIEEAISRSDGDENATDVLIALARGTYALFASENSAAVAQLVRWPRQSVFTVLYASGKDLASCRSAFEFGKQWCRANGVQVFRIHARAGWERALGLKRRGVILEERL